eukprot:8207612-Lingulodinium_polyedra.AAC.1
MLRSPASAGGSDLGEGTTRQRQPWHANKHPPRCPSCSAGSRQRTGPPLRFGSPGTLPLLCR